MHSTLDECLLRPLRDIADSKEVVRINDLQREINDNITLLYMKAFRDVSPLQRRGAGGEG